MRVNVSPTDFSRIAPNKISVDQARQILSDMKVADLPSVIRTSPEATQILESTPRLTPSQIQEFLLRASQIK